MKYEFSAGLALLAVYLCGCGAAPPSSREVSHDPILARDEGVVVLVDVCLQRDGVGSDGDYFIVEESRHGARVAGDKLREYLEDSNILVREQSMLVCGARHGNQESIPAATRIGDDVSARDQPLSFNGLRDEGRPYVSALAAVSAYAFERAATKEESANPVAVTQLEFLDAPDVTRQETGAASLLCLGVLGTSRSGALNVLSGVGRAMVGMATGVATAGLGGDYYLIFTPGAKISGRLMEAALVDLETGQVKWSNAVRVSGNPADEKHWENNQPIELLFYELLFQPSGRELLNVDVN